MPFKPVLITDASEPGKAIAMQDGWPVIETDDGPVPWNVEKQAAALSAANSEAQARREALAEVAKALGLDVDVRNADGLAAIKARASEYPTLSSELEALRRAKAAGELGEDADEKIKNLAATLRQEEFDNLTAGLTKAEKAALEAEARADRSNAAMRKSETRQGLTEFHRQHKAFQTGTLRGFLRAAMATSDDGFRWVPTGRYDDAGSPVLVYANESTQQIKKGPDGIEPLSLEQWTESVLSRSDPYLLRTPSGSGVNKFGDPAPVGFGEMSNDQLMEAARKQANSFG